MEQSGREDGVEREEVDVELVLADDEVVESSR